MGRLQSSSRAGRACENTEITLELLILIPIAVMPLPCAGIPLRGTRVGPVKGTGVIQECLLRGLTEGRKIEQ